jgi:hypothetical protein
VEAAQAQVNVPAPPVIHPRDQLKQFVDSHFPQGSNRQLAADAFLAQLFAALDGLAALGLKFDLAEAEAAPKMEYPKLMYTGDGSVTREVSSKADEDKATADGYRTTPLPAAGPAPVQAPAQPGVAQPVHQ